MDLNQTFNALVAVHRRFCRLPRSPYPRRNQAPRLPPAPAELNLSGDEVAERLMSRNAERAQKLRHVDSIRQYNLDYTGFPALSARMQVKASYTAPGTKQFTCDFGVRIRSPSQTRSS